MTPLKASHVGIRTSRYDELLKWYQENLDFRVIHEWTVNTIKLAFIAPRNNNDFMIEVICYDTTNNDHTEEVRSGYNHLSFSVDDLDKTIASLSKRNIAIGRSFSVPDIGIRTAFISDPFGNSIEFFEAIGPSTGEMPW